MSVCVLIAVIKCLLYAGMALALYLSVSKSTKQLFSVDEFNNLKLTRLTY